MLFYRISLEFVQFALAKLLENEKFYETLTFDLLSSQRTSSNSISSRRKQAIANRLSIHIRKLLTRQIANQHQAKRL